MVSGTAAIEAPSIRQAERFNTELWVTSPCARVLPGDELGFHEGLPDDLRQILDDHTDKGLAASTAQVVLDADAGGLGMLGKRLYRGG